VHRDAERFEQVRNLAVMPYDEDVRVAVLVTQQVVSEPAELVVGIVRVDGQAEPGGSGKRRELGTTRMRGRRRREYRRRCGTLRRVPGCA
jgi:hypothetical protein